MATLFREAVERRKWEEGRRWKEGREKTGGRVDEQSRGSGVAYHNKREMSWAELYRHIHTLKIATVGVRRETRALTTARLKLCVSFEELASTHYTREHTIFAHFHILSSPGPKQGKNVSNTHKHYFL